LARSTQDDEGQGVPGERRRSSEIIGGVSHKTSTIIRTICFNSRTEDGDRYDQKPEEAATHAQEKELEPGEAGCNRNTGTIAGSKEAMHGRQ